MTVAQLIEALGRLDPKLTVVSELKDHTSPLVYYGEVLRTRVAPAVQWTSGGDDPGFYEAGDSADSVPVVFLDLAGR
jgi:hypothetical protein